MALYRKEKSQDGKRTIYICGIKVCSYRVKKALPAPHFFLHGENNHATCANPHNDQLIITIYGNNNSVHVRTSKPLHAAINIGTPESPVNDCTVEIGEDTTAGSIMIMLLESNSSVIIGRDCMFSTDIQLWASDTHCIFDSEGRLINIGRSIRIGDHCWLGHACKIMKNTSIADHSIVGMGSIVTSCFDEERCILAGVPARVVKRGISWDRQRPQQWLNEHRS